MAGFQDANWDLAVIYSGNQTQYACPDCVHVEINKGAKWLLVYGFTQSTAWQNEYQHRYNMVYVPDDDILQTTATINRVFDIHAQHGLLLSQPVLCSWLESHTASWDMVKGPTTVLRYTNFVEIMVPLFSMSVFSSTVISTMSHAETGESCETFTGMTRPRCATCGIREQTFAGQADNRRQICQACLCMRLRQQGLSPNSQRKRCLYCSEHHCSTVALLSSDYILRH